MSDHTIRGYWPGWLTCRACGLTDPDVARTVIGAADVDLCRDVVRCGRVKEGRQLSDTTWSVKKVER